MRAEVFTWRGKSLDLESRYRAAPTALGTGLPVMEIKACRVEPAFCDLANQSRGPTSMCSRAPSVDLRIDEPERGGGDTGPALVHLCKAVLPIRGDFSQAHRSTTKAIRAHSLPPLSRSQQH